MLPLPHSTEEDDPGCRLRSMLAQTMVDWRDLISAKIFDSNYIFKMHRDRGREGLALSQSLVVLVMRIPRISS